MAIHAYANATTPPVIQPRRRPATRRSSRAECAISFYNAEHKKTPLFARPCDSPRAILQMIQRTQVGQLQEPDPDSLFCPKCGSTDVRRSRGEGVVALFFAIFGRMPFRCRSCRVKFYRSAEPPPDGSD